MSHFPLNLGHFQGGTRGGEGLSTGRSRSNILIQKTANLITEKAGGERRKKGEDLKSELSLHRSRRVVLAAQGKRVNPVQQE